MIDKAEWGLLFQLESARQALEEAGKDGLTGADVLRSAGIEPRTKQGGTGIQSFLLKLTVYCAIYESDSGRRYYLDPEIDENFHRRISPSGLFGDTDITDEEDIL